MFGICFLLSVAVIFAFGNVDYKHDDGGEITEFHFKGFLINGKKD